MSHSPATSAPAADALKRWRTAQAEAALAGLVAHLGTDDMGRPELICSRWNLVRSFTDPGEFDAWLARVRRSAP